MKKLPTHLQKGLGFCVFKPLYLMKTSKINLIMQSQSIAYIVLTGNHFGSEVCAPIVHCSWKSTSILDLCVAWESPRFLALCKMHPIDLSVKDCVKKCLIQAKLRYMNWKKSGQCSSASIESHTAYLNRSSLRLKIDEN